MKLARSDLIRILLRANSDSGAAPAAMEHSFGAALSNAAQVKMREVRVPDGVPFCRELTEAHSIAGHLLNRS